jgi:hypothetical protein
MSAAPTLSEARAAFVLAMLRRNGPFGLFTLAEEGEYRHARGLTLQQRDAAIDAFVARGCTSARKASGSSCRRARDMSTPGLHPSGAAS